MTVTNATKYRIAVRALAVEKGWKFVQTTTGTDRFERAGVVVDVHHGQANRIAAAEMTDGKSFAKTTRAAKMLQVQTWLTGEAVDRFKTSANFSDEQLAQFESGKGIALIKKIAPKVPAKDTKVEAK